MGINKSDGFTPFPHRVWFVLLVMAESTVVDFQKNVSKLKSVKHINIRPCGFYNPYSQTFLTV